MGSISDSKPIFDLLQVAIKELKTLYNDCRSNICIEHATGVMEEEKAPENLSKKISSISLTGNDKKVRYINLASIWKLVIDFWDSGISSCMPPYS